MAVTTIVFDAYGTLFDVNAAARQAAAEPAFPMLTPLWPQLAEDWRRKQLEYTWLRSLMGLHADFAQVTAEALDWALAAQGLGDPALRARLLALYDTLPAYAEVPAMLAGLKARGMATAILSNGTPGMLAAATGSARIGDWLDALISVEAAGIYKPAPRVYHLVLERFSCTPDQVLFVSSNGWDVAGASAFGFTTLWVNRAGIPQDRLPHGPAHIAADLTNITDFLR